MAMTSRTFNALDRLCRLAEDIQERPALRAASYEIKQHLATALREIEKARDAARRDAR